MDTREGYPALQPGSPAAITPCPDIAVCAQRAAAREEGRIEDYSPYQELYGLFEAADRHIVGNDDLTPSEAATVILTGMTQGRFSFS